MSVVFVNQGETIVYLPHHVLGLMYRHYSNTLFYLVRSASYFGGDYYIPHSINGI